MSITRQFIVAVVVTMIALPVLAQQPGDPDDITIAPINYGVTVNDVITEAYFYDWWLIRVQSGATIQVTMTGSEGLEPLVGLLAPNRELVARSEDGSPNTTVSFVYTAEETGEYTVVATRTGNQQGTSVGAYSLKVELLATPTPEPSLYRQVTLDCNGVNAANALTLEFEDDKDQTDFITVSVYGLDGFQPALRTTLEFDFEPFYDQFCVTPEGEGPGVGEGDRLTLPGEDGITFTGGVAKTNFRDANAFGIIQLNVAALNNTGGRYVVVIDGMTVGRDGDRDLLEIGLGPLAQETSLQVYATSDKNSRLDSNLELVNADVDVLRSCDDAGGRGCENVAPIDGFAWFSAEHLTQAEGGKFDAGLRLAPGSPDKQRVLIGGFGGRTYGDYTLVIIGEMPLTTSE